MAEIPATVPGPNPNLPQVAPSEVLVPDLTSLPGARYLLLIRAIYNYFLPRLNILLSQYGYVRLPPGLPPSEQIIGISRYVRTHHALSEIISKEAEDIRDMIAGAYIAAGVKPESVAPGTEAGDQISKIADTVAGYIPTLYLINPGIIRFINPRSSFPLADRISKVFARNTTFKNPKQVGEIAARSAKEILSDPTKHQGFNADQIAYLVEHAAQTGLLSFESPIAFTNSLISLIKLAAPIKEEYAVQGKTFNPAETVALISTFVQKYPTVPESELGLLLRQEFALKRRGGELGMLALDPGAREYIRRSGVPIEQLKEEHEKLKESAANSIFGSALGAIAKLIRTGKISLGSPAGKLFQLANSGQPLPIWHPMQFVNVMIRSGVHPSEAVVLMMYPEESQHWLTPQMLISLRLTQFNADWARRFAAVLRSGVSPFMAESILSRIVRQAGYKNIHHFLALHGDVMQRVPEFRELALREAMMAQQLASSEIPWGGWARFVSRLQDVGSGRKEEPVTIGDFLGPIFQFYKIPDKGPLGPWMREYGLNPPAEPEERERYLFGTQPAIETFHSGERSFAPTVWEWFNPKDYYPTG